MTIKELLQHLESERADTTQRINEICKSGFCVDDMMHPNHDEYIDYCGYESALQDVINYISEGE